MILKQSYIRIEHFIIKDGIRPDLVEYRPSVKAITILPLAHKRFGWQTSQYRNHLKLISAVAGNF